MSIHDGHRERLRQRFITGGLDSFHDVNALELLLFYAIPRRDTNNLAHQLLQQFGSLPGVLDATVEDLCNVPGMTENAATLLRLVDEINRRQMISRASLDVVNTTEEAGQYLLPFFFGRRDEMLYVLCLDAKGKVLCCRGLFEGGPNATAISVRKIVEVTISANATNVVIAHNHPGGLAIPSTEDIEATRQIWAALRCLGIFLLDHLVIADDDYVSMADNGVLRKFEQENPQ